MTPEPPHLSNLLTRVWRAVRPPHQHRAAFEGVLGTALDLLLVTDRPDQARAAEDALLAKIDRLERIFSRFDPHSELNRWLGTGGEVPVSPELGALLQDGLHWLARSGGAFHPGADALGALWRRCAAEGRAPDEAERHSLVEALKAPPYSVREDGRAATCLTSLGLNFNAIAKGRIVDLACRAALATPGVREVLLNIGGDLRHVGPWSRTVAIADPFTSADNAPPVTLLRLQNQSLATSGGTHRGFEVAGRHLTHVLDPHNGQPAEAVVGVSVCAPDCATADVLATALNVLPPEAGLALADSVPGVGCLIVTRDRQHISNAPWRAQARPTSPRGPS